MSKLAPSGSDWNENEREHIGRLAAVCREAADWEMECNRSDAGDPWCIVYDRKRDRTVLHLARIDRRYLIVWPEGSKPVRMATIAKAVDTALTEIGPQIAFGRYPHIDWWSLA
jgi:hypothetical protein